MPDQDQFTSADVNSTPGDMQSSISPQSQELIEQLSQMSQFLKTLSQTGPIHNASAQRIVVLEQRLTEAGKREKKQQDDIAEMRKAMVAYEGNKVQLEGRIKELEETIARMDDHPEVKARKTAEKKALKETLEREIAELEGKSEEAEEKKAPKEPKIKVQ